MTDLTGLYTSTLKILGDVLVQMTSPEWDAMIQEETPETRRQAALAMLKVQQARLTLANAALTEISEALEENDAALRKGIGRLQAALDAFDRVERVLKGITAVLGVVAKVVSLA